jgi:hypothetical protein
LKKKKLKGNLLLTLSFAFVEYEDSKTAKLAHQKLQGFLFDPKRKINLVVYTFEEFEMVKNISEDKAPEIEKEVYVETPFLKNWLFDRYRDQFAIRYYDTTEVLWNELSSGPESVIKKQVRNFLN